jgi:hypothetical protein
LFQIDFAFLMSVCPALKTVRRLIIVHGESKDKAEKLQADTSELKLGDKLTLHKPKLSAFGSFFEHNSYSLTFLQK